MRKAPVGLVFEQPFVHTAPKESTMRFSFFIAFAFVFAASAQASQPQWPVSSPADRAIFCGAPDTETSLAYGEALNAALNDVIAASEKITAKRASVPEAMNVLKARAQCPAGSHLPLKEMAK